MSLSAIKSAMIRNGINSHKNITLEDRIAYCEGKEVEVACAIGQVVGTVSSRQNTIRVQHENGTWITFEADEVASVTVNGKHIDMAINL